MSSSSMRLPSEVKLYFFHYCVKLRLKLHQFRKITVLMTIISHTGALKLEGTVVV